MNTSPNHNEQFLLHPMHDFRAGNLLSSTLLSSVMRKLGKSKIELACLQMPVLAVSIGFDLKYTSAGVDTHIVGREHLIQSLTLNSNAPVGQQLLHRQILNREEANSLDNDLFFGESFNVLIRFDNMVEDTDKILGRMLHKVLFDLVKQRYERDGFLYFKLFTHRFFELAQFVTRELPHGSAVLLSIDDEILCI